VSRFTEPRERLRLVAAIVVIATFVALAGLAIAASRSDFSFSAPAGATPSSATQQLPPVPDLSAISTPLPARVPVAPVASGELTAVAAPDTTATPELAPPPPIEEPQPTGKPCAQLGLPAPQQVGGIQSLVRLIPLFGPFSAEAFAMLPAFQPGIDALGPLFPLFEQGLDAAAPVLDVATPVVQQLGQAGFGVLAPLYRPYREDVLAGEAQLAAYLQPIVASLAQAPGSECLVALEGLLASLQPGAQ
jgi:hypothetical protein